MMHLMRILFALSLLAILGCSHNPQTNSPSSSNIQPPPSLEIPGELNLTRIAFGSCANQDAPQPLWKSVEANNPQLFIFMGDNVYASHPKQKPISKQYDKLSQHPEYLRIRKQVPFLAIWDDHDYGENDGGSSNTEKLEARREFLRHWTYANRFVPPDRDGVYHSLSFGPEGKRVQIILLDTRWNRSDLEKVNNPLTPLKKFKPTSDKTKTLLGESQWQWLEGELKKPADLRIIVSSIQFLAEAHGFEKWGNFPHEKKRLMNLLSQNKIKNAIVLSGDRHIGTIARSKLKNGAWLYDITASAINRPGNFNESDSSYVHPIFTPVNFGLMEIDWKEKSLRVGLRDIDNKEVYSVKTRF